MMNKIINYPKTNCVYKRQDTEGHYCVYPEVNDDMEWVFEPGVLAVDKLDGTNVCVVIEERKVIAIDNRANRIVEHPCLSFDYGKQAGMFMSGICNSLERGWLQQKNNARVYGEMIGPKINGNRHEVDRPYFVPFEFLKSKCHWKSWVEGKYPKDFYTVKEWMLDLPSLFSKRYFGKDIKAEGLVFHHPDGRVAKLRGDMYWEYYYSRKNERLEIENELRN